MAAPGAPTNPANLPPVINGDTQVVPYLGRWLTPDFILEERRKDHPDKAAITYSTI